MKIISIISGIFMGCLITLQAQTNSADTLLKREMLLEKEYAPTVKEASRINYLPEVKDIKTSKSVVEYSNYALPFQVQPQIIPLKAEDFFTQTQDSPYKGYVTAGIGMGWNIDANLGYRILNTEKDKLDIYASNRSTNAKVPYVQTDEHTKMKLNDTWGAATYSHKFNLFSVFGGLKYTYSSFNYYGYPITPEGIIGTLPTVDKNVCQVNNMIDVNLGMTSQDQGDLNYLVKFNYINFKQKYATSKELEGPKESIGKADWDINWLFSGDNKLGIAGYLQGISYAYSQPEGAKYYSGYNSYGQLSLNPYIRFDNDVWKARIGAKFHFNFDHGDPFSLAPDLAFSLFPSSNSELYLTASGGVFTNSNYAIFHENRYTTPQNRVIDSQTKIDAVLGYKMNVQDNLWFNIFAGYKMDKDAHFFRPVYPYNIALNSTIAENVALADTMNANLFKVGIHAKYQYQDIFEIGLKAQYNAWDVDDFNRPVTSSYSSKAWNKPVFEWDFTAMYQFTFPLRLDLIYHLESGRDALVNDQVRGIKNINEVNLTGTYTFNKAFSIYLKMNNFLSQHYDLWYGYPAEGANLMAGASFKF